MVVNPNALVVGQQPDRIVCFHANVIESTRQEADRTLQC